MLFLDSESSFTILRPTLDVTSYLNDFSVHINHSDKTNVIGGGGNLGSILIVPSTLVERSEQLKH